LLTVINDVLDFSKIEADRLDIDDSDFYLRDSVSDMVRALTMRAHERGLEVACQFAQDVPNALVGDPGRLRQIITNLMGNAIKFTEKGEIVIAVETLSMTDKDVTLHFSVRDTGIGIAADKQAMIFQPFTQADGSATRKYGGTGLGLTISSRLVEMMGGRMWVESEVGLGSTFHFTTRFDLQSDPIAYRIPTPPVDIQGLRVLIVDDNATNRRILEDTLNNWRMKPTSVESGIDAISAMMRAREEGNPFNLVLLDVCMPDMDGFSVAEHIKETPDLNGATIMMLSSLGLRGDSVRCKRLGVAAYLVKPVLQENLLEAIVAALGAQGSESRGNRLISQHSLKQNRQFHILLAEDNPVNQRLAVLMLEKRGHSVVVASNGAEALNCLEREPFDCVLMDIQMPQLNGLQVTGIIREKERLKGSHLPIIAMTAHAMKGDRERCLEAGMDGYVSKPVRADELFEVIESLVTTSSKNIEAGIDLIDRSVLLNNFDGDPEFLQMIVDTFLEIRDDLFSQTDDAIRKGDGAQLAYAAHSLKGAVANFQASVVTAAAKELEMMGRENNLAGAGDRLIELEQMIERVLPALNALIEEWSLQSQYK